ncbi:MAG: protein-L-isoaspartate O-methyltransferase [Spirochaetota bacterium]
MKQLTKERFDYIGHRAGLICPECGFDVPKAGLCPDCKAELKRRRKGRQKAALITSPRLLTILMWICVSILLCEVSFLFGRFSITGILEIPFIDGLKPGSAVSETVVEDTLPATTPFLPEQSVIENSPVAETVQTAKFDLDLRNEKPVLNSEDTYVKWILAKTGQDERLVRWRWKLAQALLKSGDISTKEVLEAFLRTPREEFCRPQNLPRVYDDVFLSIGYGVTISDPNVVCRMTETIKPSFNQKILEIGTGSGYQAAILAELSNHVYTVEIIEPLARETDIIYKQLEKKYPQYSNVNRKIGDGYYGWTENAPFDRIIVTCGIDHIPPPLLSQLAPDGIMVIPIGPRGRQTLLKVWKKVLPNGGTVIEREDVYKGKMKVRFVPLTDKTGGVHSKE